MKLNLIGRDEPKKSFTASIHESVYNAIQEAAVKNGITNVLVIRSILNDWLELMEAEKQQQQQTTHTEV
jgi:hypothetical protein